MNINKIMPDLTIVQLKICHLYHRAEGTHIHTFAFEYESFSGTPTLGSSLAVLGTGSGLQGRPPALYCMLCCCARVCSFGVSNAHSTHSIYILS